VFEKSNHSLGSYSGDHISSTGSTSTIISTQTEEYSDYLTDLIPNNTLKRKLTSSKPQLHLDKFL